MIACKKMFWLSGEEGKQRNKKQAEKLISRESLSMILGRTTSLSFVGR